jgi:NitT/TauT family transport system substrate-binding protein
MARKLPFPGTGSRHPPKGVFMDQLVHMPRRVRHGLVARLALAAALGTLLAVGLSSSAAAKPQALKKVSLRLDFLIRGHHSGFFVALDKGWYRDAGLDVSISEGTGSAATAQSVAAGNDTFGFVDATSMIAANAQGAGLKMVANMRARNGTAIMVRKDSSINTPADLAGKKLAITPPGTFFSNIWPLYATAAGIDASKVNLVPMSNFIFLQQFEAGNVDAMIGLLDGELTQLQLAHIPTRVFPFAEKGFDTISHGIVVKASMIQSDPATVKAFVQASMRGWRYMLSNPNLSVGILQKYYPHIDPKQYVARIKGVKKVISTPNNAGHPLGWMSKKDWGKTTFLLTKYGGVSTLPSGLANLYTNQFIAPCKHKARNPKSYCT